MHDSLSPLDGRYAAKVEGLRAYFSEAALMRYRVLVEIKWLICLASRDDIPQLPPLSAGEISLLEAIAADFSTRDFERIATLEKATNHDVKAVEYFLKEKLEGSSLHAVSEWVHFALTSEDVNNLAYALMLKEGITQGIRPLLGEISVLLTGFASDFRAVPMLARTHGQPASPTTMGKEMLIFLERLARQLRLLDQQEYLGKLAGASGNFNAHAIAFPEADWLDISRSFVEKMGLAWNPVVPQIEPHDFIAEIAHGLIRINTILIDLSRDIWGYISLGFFRQRLKAGEVGSSAMPHKVNPIDFENAEGNLGLSTALFAHFAEKLPISRWQRDLTDSTVLRNLGVACGHLVLALASLKQGFSKLQIDEGAIAADLDAHPEVLAEAIQTVMRAAGSEKPYEKLKALTRGHQLDLPSIRTFIKTLELPPEQKEALLALTPAGYTGLARRIVETRISD